MFTVAQIEQAHEKVKSGSDFPPYIQEIKLLGVQSFETYVSDSHTQYFGMDGYRTSSEPKYAVLAINQVSDKEKFTECLIAHQQGHTDYLTFCKDCAHTGIDKWFVNLQKMTCTYFDKEGTVILEEQIPH